MLSRWDEIFETKIFTSRNLTHKTETIKEGIYRDCTGSVGGMVNVEKQDRAVVHGSVGLGRGHIRLNLSVQDIGKDF